MMKKKLLGILFGTSLVLAACGGNDGGGETSTEADPEKIVSQKCMSCHGENLDGGAGPKISDVGSRLSKDEILNVLEKGKGSMPPGIIEGEQAEAVAEWLANKK